MRHILDIMATSAEQDSFVALQIGQILRPISGPAPLVIYARGGIKC